MTFSQSSTCLRVRSDRLLVVPVLRSFIDDPPATVMKDEQGRPFIVVREYDELENSVSFLLRFRSDKLLVKGRRKDSMATTLSNRISWPLGRSQVLSERH